MSVNEPTHLGRVSSVNGSSVSVELAPQLNSGLLVIGGKTHRIGQVGSFVLRIPQGYNNLFGIISETSESSAVDDINESFNTTRRWIKVELVGEVVGDVFERGIGQFPSINDEAHIVTDKDLESIYGGDTDGKVVIGKLSSSDSIDVSLDLEKLVTRHSAILGSTGSGKSTSVSSLIRSMVSRDSGENVYLSSRIVLIDIHGEYTRALGDISKVFSIIPKDNQYQLNVPYWCVSPEKLLDFLCGNISEKNKTYMLDKILEGKMAFYKANKNNKEYKDVDKDKIFSQTPIPYNLRRLWYEAVYDDNVTWEEKEKKTPSVISLGGPEKLVAPEFRPPGTGGQPPFKGEGGLMRRSLDQFRSRMLDAQYTFLVSPGDWEPDEKNKVKKDLSSLMESWIGHSKPITILDLSGIPSATLELIVGSLLDILFEASIWGRNLPEGMKSRPLLMVLEEAHRYLSNENSGLAKEMVRRIAKEGRKFGLGSMLISQRPSEIDETILSQCGTFIALRINNQTDRGRVKGAMSDGISGLIDTLPILRTGEAIIAGEAAKLPMRCRFRLPKKGHYPDSVDPQVAKLWQQQPRGENYIGLASAWRNQKPEPGVKEKE